MGVLVRAPFLSRVTTGKTKKEGAMQETHCNGGGGGNRDSGESEVAATQISCCLSKNCEEPRQPQIRLCTKQLFNFRTAHKCFQKFKCL